MDALVLHSGRSDVFLRRFVVCVWINYFNTITTLMLMCPCGELWHRRVIQTKLNLISITSPGSEMMIHSRRTTEEGSFLVCPEDSSEHAAVYRYG